MPLANSDIVICVTKVADSSRYTGPERHFRGQATHNCFRVASAVRDENAGPLIGSTSFEGPIRQVLIAPIKKVDCLETGAVFGGSLKMPQDASGSQLASAAMISE